MKHLILTILFTLTLFAQEIGVPYVPLEKSSRVILGTNSLFVLNGKAILFYDEKQNIRLWDLKTGKMDKCITVENSTDKENHTLSFTSNGKSLVFTPEWFDALTASNDLMFITFQGKIDVWDIATWKKIKEIETPKDFTGHSEHIELLHVDRVNNKLIGAGYKRNILIWNLPDMKLEKVLRGSEFSPYEKDGYIPINPYQKGHEGPVSDVSGIVDGKYIFSISSTDKTLRKWNIESGEEVDRIDGQAFHNLQLVDNDRQIMALLHDSLIFYQTTDLNMTKKYGTEIGNYSNTAIISPSQAHLYTTGNNGMLLKEWDMKRDQEIRQLPVDKPTVMTTTFQNGKYIAATAERGKRGIIYRISDFKEVLNVFIVGSCDWVAITPDGYFNASEDVIGSIRIKDTNGTERVLTPKEIKKYKQPQKIQAILNDIISTNPKTEKY
jgi:WD40 repeat protein